MKIRNIAFVILIMINACKCQSNSTAPGYEFSNFNKTPLKQLAKAVEKNDSAAIGQLVRNENIDINLLDPKFHQSLLTLSIWHSRVAALNKLLELGANPNIRSPNDSITPFLTACSLPKFWKDLYLMLDLLIKHGADVNAQQVYTQIGQNMQPYLIKKSALRYICNNGSVEELILLLDNGGDLNLYPKNGNESLLCESDANSSLDIMHFLLIEKKMPVPDYCVIRNSGTPFKKEITLRDLVLERAFLKNIHEQKLEKDILSFLK